MSEQAISPGVGYWDDRARRFAGRGRGLAAVCSYGMPLFYNAAIDLTQRLALGRWLRVEPGTAVLDVGCGIGRWSRRLARRGAVVTGVDLSPAMIAEAEQRTLCAGLTEGCRFLVSGLESLSLGQRFPLILGVTVLQHILEAEGAERALRSLADHLEEGGRLVLLEAAPTRTRGSCETRVFRARTLEDYRRLSEAAGLRLTAVHGVDPMPCKLWLLPHFRHLPRALGVPLMALATAVSLPVDALLGRRLTKRSWHKVLVLERAGGRR